MLNESIHSYRVDFNVLDVRISFFYVFIFVLADVKLEGRRSEVELDLLIYWRKRDSGIEFSDLHLIEANVGQNSVNSVEDSLIDKVYSAAHKISLLELGQYRVLL